MAKGILLFLIVFCKSITGIGASDGSFLTAEERAYLYHVIQKSNTLYRNLNHLFEYTGDIPKVKGVPDYDSIEKIIILSPDKLKINFYEISKMPPGILAEASMKLSLWKLNKSLKTLEKKEENTSEEYQHILKYLIERAPITALKKQNKSELRSEIEDIFNPGVSAETKLGYMRPIKEMSFHDIAALMNHYSVGISELAEAEAQRLFLLMGGSFLKLNNYLLAAGEGSSTAGLLDASEKNEQGKPDKKKPVGIGLFNYQYIKGLNEQGKNDVLVKTNPSINIEGFKGGSASTLHLSIWGFNNFFQATVVVQNGDKNYLVFGNKLTNELSPDSTHGGGVTIFKHLADLKDNIIPEEEQSLFKKGGLKEKWDVAKVKEKQAFDMVRQKEYELRMVNYVEQRKKYKALQQEYLHWASTYEEAKIKTRAAHEAYKKQWYYVNYLHDRLYEIESDLGNYLLPVVQDDSLFTYADGTTFNLHTQDLEISKINKEGRLLVRLIALGSKPLSKRVDEVQLFVCSHEKKPEMQIDVAFEGLDIFDSDAYLPPSTLGSGELSKIAAFIAEYDPVITLSLEGHGVGKITDGAIAEAGKEVKELKAYPGKSAADREQSKQKDEFKLLRIGKVRIKNSSSLVIQVDSYTDPIISNILLNSINDSIASKYPGITANELLSAYRTMAIAETVINELKNKVSANVGDDFKRNAASIARLEKALKSAWVRVNKYAIPYSTYLIATGRK
jgi:hypothetical protein